MGQATGGAAPGELVIRRPRSWRRDHGLGHIPGDFGLPIVGSTFEYLADQDGWAQRRADRYGPVFRSSSFFEVGLTVVDPDEVERLLKDKERIFSSEHGWDNLVGLFFKRGLMLLDFDVHRLHRGILTEAFKKSALHDYLDLMTPRIEAEVSTWGSGGFEPFYPRVKRLTLDLAGVVFAGEEPGAELDRMSAAFVAMMQGLFTMVRLPIPFTTYARGVKARRFMEDWVQRRVEVRRRTSGGKDLLSQLCAAKDEAGNRLTDREVVDHMIFLMLAAHDTTTSALTNLVWELGRTPAWQDRLRAQLQAVPGPVVKWEDLAVLCDIDLALKETLRLHPPVSAIPRFTLRDCEIGGYAVPAQTVVWIDSNVVHRNPKYWSNPASFDPDRFGDARAEHRRHPAIWIPYSSGAHVCLGLQFSIVQVKAVLHALLTRYRIELREGYAPKRQLVPFPKPVDDLPVRLIPL